MTQKEKDMMNLMVWKMARKYLRAEKKNASEEKLDGMFAMMNLVDYMFNVNFTDLMDAIEKGKSYEEIFGDE